MLTLESVRIELELPTIKCHVCNYKFTIIVHGSTNDKIVNNGMYISDDCYCPNCANKLYDYHQFKEDDTR